MKKKCYCLRSERKGTRYSIERNVEKFSLPLNINNKRSKTKMMMMRKNTPPSGHGTNKQRNYSRQKAYFTFQTQNFAPHPLERLVPIGVVFQCGKGGFLGDRHIRSFVHQHRLRTKLDSNPNKK